MEQLAETEALETQLVAASMPEEGPSSSASNSSAAPEPRPVQVLPELSRAGFALQGFCSAMGYIDISTTSVWRFADKCSAKPKPVLQCHTLPQELGEVTLKAHAIGTPSVHVG